MRAIAQPFFDASPAMAGPLLGLLLFVAFFVAVVVVTLRARTPELDQAAALPLEHDEPTPGVRAAQEPSRQEPV